MPGTKTLTALLIAGLIAFTGAAYAQKSGHCDKGKDQECQDGLHKPCHMRGETCGMLPHHKPMIPDLTDEQKEKIEALRVDHLAKIQPLKNEMGEKRARLRTLVTAEKVNMSDVNKLIDGIGTLRTKMMKLQVQHRQDIRSLLTDKQRVIFDSHGPDHDRCMGGKEKMHHSEPE